MVENFEPFPVNVNPPFKRVSVSFSAFENVSSFYPLYPQRWKMYLLFIPFSVENYLYLPEA